MNENIDQPEPEPDERPFDEGVICTACLDVNPPRTDYCWNCGAPLSSLLTFSPFERTLIEGFAFRRAVDGPPSRIVLVGMWLWFGPPLLFIPALVSNGGADLPGSFAPMTGLSLFSIIILYRTTTNYLKKGRPQEATRPSN